MKKLAIIGASYLQVPLIKKANEMGLETHVFAWEEGAVGKELATVFYPISILEKEKILKACAAITIDGITSIASDIAMPTVNYVAHHLGLIGNSLESTLISTDKFEMRNALSKKGIPCPRFAFYNAPNFANSEQFSFPIMVKPTDRSGSRGVTKVNNVAETNAAIKKALAQSINKKVIVEEFISGREISVEGISYQGEHHILAVTDKVTTGEPYFVELAHHQPAQIEQNLKDAVINLTTNILMALGLENGASHTELITNENNEILLVEVAGRMGGDFIGARLTSLTTGVDTLRAVIEISLNIRPNLQITEDCKHAGILFLSKQTEFLKTYFLNPSDLIIETKLFDTELKYLESSADRSGYFIYQSNKREFYLNGA